MAVHDINMQELGAGLFDLANIVTKSDAKLAESIDGAMRIFTGSLPEVWSHSWIDGIPPVVSAESRYPEQFRDTCENSALPILNPSTRARAETESNDWPTRSGIDVELFQRTERHQYIHFRIRAVYSFRRRRLVNNRGRFPSCGMGIDR